MSPAGVVGVIGLVDVIIGVVGVVIGVVIGSDARMFHDDGLKDSPRFMSRVCRNRLLQQVTIFSVYSNNDTHEPLTLAAKPIRPLQISAEVTKIQQNVCSNHYLR